MRTPTFEKVVVTEESYMDFRIPCWQSKPILVIDQIGEVRSKGSAQTSTSKVTLAAVSTVIGCAEIFFLFFFFRFLWWAVHAVLTHNLRSGQSDELRVRLGT